MNSRVRATLMLLCLATGRGLHAQANNDSALSLQGFSGILNTPNAHVQREGTFDALSSKQKDNIPGQGIPNREESYLFSIGMFSFAEVGGRLTNTANGDLFTSTEGIRHLSANLKLSTDPLTSRFRFSPAVAVGLQDVGGQTHFFDTKYLAGSADPVGWLRLSAGYGRGPDRMKGEFGGMELRAHDWVTLLADYDTSNTNVGVRLTSPPLPYLPARLTAVFSTPVERAQELAISGGFTIPLDFRKSARHGAASVADSGKAEKQKTLWGAFAAKTVQRLVPEPLPLSPAVSSRFVASAVPASAAVALAPEPGSLTNNAEPVSLSVLRERLVKAGFVNVRVGQQEKTLVVEYENIRYNHNELDAIGVVAGIASQAAGNGAEQLRLVVGRRGLALLQIEAPLLPLRDWLEGGALTNAPALTVTQKVARGDEVGFVVGDDNPGRLKPSVMVCPSLVTLVGTEYGVFDYQLSIRPELQLPLWPGATGVARWDLPVAWSGNLDNGQIYSSYRTPEQMDRLMFFQALRLAPGLVANLGAGKVLTSTNGVLNELSWTPGGGLNRFKAIQSWGRDDGSTRNVLLGSYRFFLARRDLAFEGIGGRFWGQDTGGMVSMQRFFGDSSVSLYFKDTKTSTDATHWRHVGIQVEFPLTPRRDMKARPLQIRGSEDWIYAQETAIGSSANSIEPSLATVPESAESLALYFYDRERLNRDYILSHTARIKEAWWLFRDEVR